MKPPEKTTYIWRKIGDEKHLIMVCPSISAAARYLIKVGAKTENSVKNISNSLYAYMDTEIAINNEYLLTSFLKWKSKEKQQSEDIIEAFANPKPQHLRFTGFSFKFDPCDDLQGQMTTNS
jgi:hypothetical protein